jgi:hypothetical protein
MERRVRPFQGAEHWMLQFPGRCPGLICGCPLRGEIRSARLQRGRVGLVWPASLMPVFLGELLT